MPIRPEPVARITALVVAQDAFQDNRGRTHIIGIFDTVGAPKFPVNMSFMIYCAVKGQGTHTVLIRMEDSLGERIVESEAMIVEVTPQRGHQIFTGFGVTLKAPGLYRVIAFMDGITEIEHPLFMREEAPTKPGASRP